MPKPKRYTQRVIVEIETDEPINQKLATQAVDNELPLPYYKWGVIERKAGQKNATITACNILSYTRVINGMKKKAPPSRDNTKAYLPTEQEITESFINDLRKTIQTSLETPINSKSTYLDHITQQIIDLILDYEPTR